MDSLDSAILEYISLHYGKCPANSMMLADIAKHVSTASVSWRVVDRRTQALRKQGKIKLDARRKWVIAGA
jgi:hypothetical protein